MPSLITHFGKPKIIAAVAILLAVVFVVVLYIDHTQNKGESYALTIDSEPFCLDPQAANSSAERAVLINLFTPLGDVIEDADVSADGRQYVFTLDGKSKWQIAGDSEFDDLPVTAEDFAFAVSRISEPNIEKAIALSGQTLQIILKESDPHFQSKLSDIKYSPCNRAFFQSTKAKYGMEPKFLLSNHFYLSSWSHGTGLFLVRGKDSIKYTISEDPLPLFNAKTIDAGIFGQRPTRPDVDIEIRHKGSYGITLGTSCELSEIFKYGTRITNPPADGKLIINPNYNIGLAKEKMADKKITDLSVIVIDGNNDTADEVLQLWQKELNIFGVVERLPEKDFYACLAAGDFDVAFTESPTFLALYQIPSYYCRANNAQFVGDFIRVP